MRSRNKTQNIDMKAVSIPADQSQHFSIFLRGCKQPNFSTLSFRAAKIYKNFDMQIVV